MKQFDIKEAIDKNRIIVFPDGPKIMLKELRTAKEDLQDAKDVMELKKYKLATI